MAREPDHRYADMAAMAEDLRSYLEGRVVRAHRTGAIAELRKWMGRNPIASRLAVVSLLASLALVAAGTMLATKWDEVQAGEAQAARALREAWLEGGFLARAPPDPWRNNYWSAGKSAGLAVAECTDAGERSFWRERAIDWLMLYLRTCEQANDVEDPNITPQVYARLLNMAQASSAFASLREPLEDGASADDHERCAALWQWIESELDELGR